MVSDHPNQEKYPKQRIYFVVVENYVYLVPQDAERPEVAGQVADSLAQCGIKAEVDLWEWDPLLGPGPEALPS